jgi:hypothetical protein
MTLQEHFGYDLMAAQPGRLTPIVINACERWGLTVEPSAVVNGDARRTSRSMPLCLNRRKLPKWNYTVAPDL